MLQFLNDCRLIVLAVLHDHFRTQVMLNWPFIKFRALCILWSRYSYHWIYFK